MNRPTGFALAAVALGLASGAGADERVLRLKDAPDAATVRAHCSACHSIDYILMNAPFLKRAGWESEVRKMVKVMGAPVPDDEAARIVDYLVRQYGVE